jgi:hypothetical protein
MAARPGARPKAQNLTDDQVTQSRSGLHSDSHLARLWKRPRQIVRLARIGLTFPHNPTPPDTRPRRRGRGSKDGAVCVVPIPVAPQSAAPAG